MRENKKTVVIKLGGHAMADQPLLDAFAEDVHKLGKAGFRFVIVHGGGPHINTLLERLDIRSRFINGLRVTEKPVLEAVEMALCGTVNKAVVRQLAKFGVRAVGISGEDGDLFTAKIKSPELGLVGAITQIDRALPETLLTGGFVPVVAPLALSEKHEPLNINADTAAGALAGALQADFFLLISDVPGVLDKNGSLLPHLACSIIDGLIADGTISGGMIPKTECCLHALAAGCQTAIILDGTSAHSVASCLEGANAGGTVIR